MEGWYYAPWQYELRGHLTQPRGTVAVARRYKVPDPVTGTVLVGAFFLAYAPLLQPGPPAKAPIQNTLPIYNVGRFVV